MSHTSSTSRYGAAHLHTCSDIDILCHWLSPGSPTRVSSFGSLQHFRKSQKPPQAGDAKRCLDCAYERDCAYSAKKSACSRSECRNPACSRTHASDIVFAI